MKLAATLTVYGILTLSGGFLRADSIGTASSFAVLGASTVTNTGTSVISGNVGVSPGTAITGFPPGIVNNGMIHDNDGVAAQAQADAQAGYNALVSESSTQILTGQDLGGQTLTPGVYFFATSAELTGALTLNFEGLSDADIVFQIGSTLTTASASTVDIINMGTDDNVFWQVGTSATLGTTTAFQGTIIADQSITLTTGATINCGNAIALNGAVTLDSNTIGVCPTSDTGGSDGSGGVSPVPEPGTLTLLATGIFGAAGVLRRRFAA